MWIRYTVLTVMTFALIASTPGCNKSDKGARDSLVRSTNGPAASVHWIGYKRLVTLDNALGFLRIWRLPESERLRSQTLDKLALAPWMGPATNTTVSITNTAPLVKANPKAALLRPLLDDLVQEEFYLEIREAGQTGARLALAVRTDARRSALWESNLGSLCEGATASRRVTPKDGNKGWSLDSANLPAGVSPLLRHVQLTHIGEWTVVGLASEQNTLFADFVSKLQKNQLVAKGGNDWLQTALDLQRVSDALAWGWRLPEDWPRISLNVSGDGTNVVTRGGLEFARPLPFEIEPWNIPTNLIHEPIHSFTAVQGVKKWISDWPEWEKLHSPSAPNQIFTWAQAGSPFLDYAAAPLADASKAMSRLGPGIMDQMNPTLLSNRMGKWERSTNSDGVVLIRTPIVLPFVQSVTLSAGSFLVAGLSPLAITNTPAPVATLRDLLAQKGVVYFDRELTGPRVEAWMYISQLSRVVFRRAQLPSESAAVNWLKAVGPLLAPSLTTVTRSAPNQLQINRTSAVGFTASELHLLSDWLEGSQFPKQAHSQTAQYPPLPEHKK